MKSLILVFCLFLGLAGSAQVKNTLTEVLDYREVDGKIVVKLVVNGVYADFALDLAGHTAILPEYLEKFKVDTTVEGKFGYADHQYKNVRVGRIVEIGTILLGNSVFVDNAPAFVLREGDYLRKLGVAGVIGGALFRNVVLTIDGQRRKLTLSNPYRPSYMKLDHRTLASIQRGSAMEIKVNLDGTDFSLIFDTWNEGAVELTAPDFEKLNGNIGNDGKINLGYGERNTAARSRAIGSLNFVKDSFSGMQALENPSLLRSVLGKGILEHGLVSIDYQKQKIYFQRYGLVEIKDNVRPVDEVKVVPGKLNPITRDYFLKHIIDYRKDKNAPYQGEKPVVIDFWASWCGPCMRLIPEMEKLAEKYKDKVIFLKVNADKEKEVCEMYDIRALPTLFFIPAGGTPIREVGVNPVKFAEIIEQKLLDQMR